MKPFKHADCNVQYSKSKACTLNCLPVHDQRTIKLHLAETCMDQTRPSVEEHRRKIVRRRGASRNCADQRRLRRLELVEVEVLLLFLVLVLLVSRVNVPLHERGVCSALTMSVRKPSLGCHVPELLCRLSYAQRSDSTATSANRTGTMSSLQKQKKFENTEKVKK